MVKHSSKAAPELLSAMREIAHSEGRQFQAVMEKPMEEYISKPNRETMRPKAMTHFRASMEGNRRLKGFWRNEFDLS